MWLVGLGMPQKSVAISNNFCLKISCSKTKLSLLRIPEPSGQLPRPHPTVSGVWKPDLSTKLKEVESKLAAEAQRNQAANSQAKKGPNRDMKKILESYKSQQGKELNKGNAEALLVAEQQRAGNEMTPIQWLRHFWKNDLKIDIDLKEICFGKQKSFPR